MWAHLKAEFELLSIKKIDSYISKHFSENIDCKFEDFYVDVDFAEIF